MHLCACTETAGCSHILAGSRLFTSSQFLDVMRRSWLHICASPAEQYPFCMGMPEQEVLALSRQLAVKTLQLEMEYAFAALEDEALDIVGYDVEGESGVS